MDVSLIDPALLAELSATRQPEEQEKHDSDLDAEGEDEEDVDAEGEEWDEPEVDQYLYVPQEVGLSLIAPSLREPVARASVEPNNPVVMYRKHRSRSTFPLSMKTTMTHQVHHRSHPWRPTHLCSISSCRQWTHLDPSGGADLQSPSLARATAPPHLSRRPHLPLYRTMPLLAHLG
jgi:hypothetical protein